MGSKGMVHGCLVLIAHLLEICSVTFKRMFKCNFLFHLSSSFQCKVVFTGFMTYHIIYKCRKCTYSVIFSGMSPVEFNGTYSRVSIQRSAVLFFYDIQPNLDLRRRKFHSVQRDLNAATLRFVYFHLHGY